jgi:CRISPR-associated endonuclease/helicase Cas3
MDKLVEILRKLHCTVIILSATLTRARREELLGQKDNEDSYPLISASPKNKSSFSLPVMQSETADVVIALENNDSEALEEALLHAERGEQVLWIENTVAESQDWFKIIAARAQACTNKIECGLLHSRFLRLDRQTNEEKWVKIYGKDGHASRKQSGRILVGTQVLEQSLDIDADFLVSRLCPTDMLLQRIGRLWRHREADPLRPSGAAREAWILAPTLEHERANEMDWGKTGRIYLSYVLYRTLEVWLQHPRISLPRDIRPMLEATYAKRSEEGILNTWKAEVEANRQKLAGLARIGFSTIGRTLPESKATTRYSETESCEVLLIRKKTPDHSGTTITLLSGKKMHLPIKAQKSGLQQWRTLAAQIQQNVALVPEYCAPETSVQQVSWLKDFVYLGNQDESPFRACIVRTDGSLCNLDNSDALPGYDLSYTPALGYRSQKKNKDDLSDIS